jgi:hypothetical protein
MGSADFCSVTVQLRCKRFQLYSPVLRLQSCLATLRVLRLSALLASAERYFVPAIFLHLRQTIGCSLAPFSLPLHPIISDSSWLPDCKCVLSLFLLCTQKIAPLLTQGNGAGTAPKRTERNETTGVLNYFVQALYNLATSNLRLSFKLMHRPTKYVRLVTTSPQPMLKIHSIMCSS